MLMISLMRAEPAWRSERLLCWYRHTIYLPPAIHEREHSMYWKSQGYVLDHWLGGGNRRGLWSHSDHRAEKVDILRRLWCCRLPFSQRYRGLWSYLNIWCALFLWSRGSPLIGAWKFLCQTLNYFLTMGFSMELGWRPRRWGVASLRSGIVSGRGWRTAISVGGRSEIWLRRSGWWGYIDRWRTTSGSWNWAWLATSHM